MSIGLRNFLFGPLIAWLGRLRFPRLLMITATLFVIDLLVPDFIPFADELLLALGTLVLSRWKRRNDPAEIDSAEIEPAKPPLPPR